MKDVIENNKLIAEFMMFETVGDLHLIPFDNTDNDTYLPEHMKFHSSWDWLMPVISKITRDESLIENEYRESIMDTVPYGSIEDTHKTVVEFIKWYNENK